MTCVLTDCDSKLYEYFRSTTSTSMSFYYYRCRPSSEPRKNGLLAVIEAKRKKKGREKKKKNKTENDGKLTDCVRMDGCVLTVTKIDFIEN